MESTQKGMTMENEQLTLPLPLIDDPIEPGDVENGRVAAMIRAALQAPHAESMQMLGDIKAMLQQLIDKTPPARKRAPASSGKAVPPPEVGDSGEALPHVHIKLDGTNGVWSLNEIARSARVRLHDASARATVLSMAAKAYAKLHKGRMPQKVLVKYGDTSHTPGDPPQTAEVYAYDVSHVDDLAAVIFGFKRLAAANPAYERDLGRILYAYGTSAVLSALAELEEAFR